MPNGDNRVFEAVIVELVSPPSRLLYQCTSKPCIVLSLFLSFQVPSNVICITIALWVYGSPRHASVHLNHSTIGHKGYFSAPIVPACCLVGGKFSTDVDMSLVMWPVTEEQAFRVRLQRSCAEQFRLSSESSAVGSGERVHEGKYEQNTTHGRIPTLCLRSFTIG